MTNNASCPHCRTWQREAQREALRANRAEDRFLRAEELLAPLGRLPELLRRYNEWKANRDQ
jgi:hypothetical protein